MPLTGSAIASVARDRLRIPQLLPRRQAGKLRYVDLDDPRAKKLSYSLHGLQQAILRCDAAHWHRPEDAFIAAADAVSWVVALDTVLEDSTDDGRDPQSYKEARGRSADGRTVIGMKFVRNYVHHADELLDFIDLSAVFGGLHGMRAGWLWKPLDDLEPFVDPQYTSGKGLYRDRLGGKVVEHTLLDANRWFSSLAPPIPELPPDLAGVAREPFALPERWPPITGDRRI